MNQAVLPPLAAVLAALLLAAAAFAVPSARRVAALALPALCALGAALSLTALADGGAVAILALPVGLPGAGVTLGLDPLAALFLLLVFTPATACFWHAPDEDRARPALAAATAVMALTVLAAGGFTMVLGLCLTALAFWAAPTGAARRAALPLLAATVAGALCLTVALALLAPSGDASFAAIRAAPHAGGAADAALILTLLGAAPLAGLAPLHAFLPAAHRGVRGPAAVLLSAAASTVALYVIVRLLFDLCGSAEPVWWGLPPLLLGAATVPLGAVRMLRAREMTAVLAAGTVANTGLVATGIGVALLGRGADLPALAALALAAVLLLALGHALVKTVLLLAAERAERAAGTIRLDRMGGLIHRMPVTTAAMLAGGASVAVLPPSVGFAAVWLLLQALIAATHDGGFAIKVLLAASLVAIALGLGLAASAVLRLVGVAFLGRPRTPRAAAAEEAPGTGPLALLGLAALSVLPGLFPGPALALLAPALRLLLGTTLDGRAGLLAVAPQAGGPGYSALGIVALLLGCGGAAVLALRHWAPSVARRAPAWEGGFAAAPPWLPFGDPLTQIGSVGFAQPLLAPLAPLPAAKRRLRARLSRMLGRRSWRAIPGTSVPLAGILAVLTALLVVAAWFGGR